MLVRRLTRHAVGLAVAGLMPCTIKMCCSYQKQIETINLQMVQHNNHLAEADTFFTYFNDAQLLNLVQTNYYLSDLVRIANSLVYHTKRQDFTEAKVLFLVYTSNLFYAEMKSAANSLYSIVGGILEQRIKAKNFSFASFEFERALLSNINFLTRRNNNHVSKQRNNVELQLFNFLCLKHRIMSEEKVYCEVNQSSLENMLSALPYLPKNSSNASLSFIVQFEQYFLRVVKLQIDKLLQIQGQIQSKNLNILINRHILLGQSAISIHKLKDQFIDICQVLPIQFVSETAFVNYLKVIKYFMTENLITAIDAGLLRHYHFLLADTNKMYRSVAAVKAMEDYVEHLIVAKYRDHIQVFSVFFDQVPFIYDVTKWKRQPLKPKQVVKSEHPGQE